MKRWLVAAAALALVATASPALVSKAQAAPPKNPFCSVAGDYTFGRAITSWADRYDCWGYPWPYFREHHMWWWGGPHGWHHHHWHWRHHHHHHHQ